MKQFAFNVAAYLILYLWCIPSINAQDWVLEKSLDEIDIFTREVPDADILELKIEFSLATRLGPLVSILDDVERYTDWVYKSLKFEEKVSAGNGQGIYYGQVDFPWPLYDRDYVIECTTKQDPETKVVTLESTTTTYDGTPEDKDYVRIPSHFNRWELRPINDNLVEITYLLKSDPGGSIPSWLVNLAIDKGAVQTIQNLKKMISTCEQNTKLAYIQEK